MHNDSGLRPTSFVRKAITEGFALLAKQNLDSLSSATFGCQVEGLIRKSSIFKKGPPTRIPYGSEGPMGPQPGTPQGGVQRNPTTNDYYHVSHQIPYS